MRTRMGSSRVDFPNCSQAYPHRCITQNARGTLHVRSHLESYGVGDLSEPRKKGCFGEDCATHVPLKLPRRLAAQHHVQSLSAYISVTSRAFTEVYDHGPGRIIPRRDPVPVRSLTHSQGSWPPWRFPTADPTADPPHRDWWRWAPTRRGLLSRGSKQDPSWGTALTRRSSEFASREHPREILG